MCVRDDIYVNNLEAPSFSVLWLLVITGVAPIVHCCVYCSHSGDEETKFFEYIFVSSAEAQHRYPAELLFWGTLMLTFKNTIPEPDYRPCW